MMRKSRIERRLQISGILIVLGLLVELITLYSSHPTAFLIFMFFGGSLIILGILYFLYSLVTADKKI